MARIIDRSDIPSLVERLRGQHKTIVTMNGSFDLIHAGHIRCLREAREQGDVLIVPLNSDTSMKSYKGKERPIIPEKDRAETIAALACVDYVVLFDDINPKKILSEIRPEVHCNGADWGPGCIERETVEQGGGRLHVLGWAPGRSSSEIIHRICTIEDSPRAIMFTKTLLQSLIEGPQAKFLPRLADYGLKTVLFSEEPAVASGEESLDHVLAEVESIRRALEDLGFSLDGAYLCTHEPKMPPACSCRPPLPGLLEQAREDLDLALGSSWVVSDDMRHITMGREVNAKTVLIGKAPEGYVKPHYEALDLSEALSVILG